MHLLGNIEPEMVFQLAQRNNISLPHPTPESLRASYEFQSLGEFLELFQQGTSVIRTEQDLYDLTWDYLTRAHADHCTHCEMYYSPHPLVSAGMTVEDAMNGVIRALNDAKLQFNLTSSLILCCLRNLPESVACAELESLQPWRPYIIAAGLASAERPFPPKLFVKHFDECRAQGLKITIHAGEDGPVDYIDQALTLLKADRIDHGNACTEDPAMIERLREGRVPLTMCPLSNLRLKVIQRIEDHPIKKLLDAGLLVTVNSDDPSFFGGYVNENYIAVQKALGLTRDDIIQLAKNSYEASFLSEEEKRNGIRGIDEYVAGFDAVHVHK
jgi:adenosine deaminase